MFKEYSTVTGKDHVLIRRRCFLGVSLSFPCRLIMKCMTHTTWSTALSTNSLFSRCCLWTASSERKQWLDTTAVRRQQNFPQRGAMLSQLAETVEGAFTRPTHPDQNSEYIHFIDLSYPSIYHLFWQKWDQDVTIPAFLGCIGTASNQRNSCPCFICGMGGAFEKCDTNQDAKTSKTLTSLVTWGNLVEISRIFKIKSNFKLKIWLKNMRHK